MGRRLRPNRPGVAFHITTRLQDRAHRFTPILRDRVVRILGRHIARSDLRLLAYVVMSNHLHLIVIQGSQPLDAFMQPFLRSVALAVQEAHGIQGHVFERRFRDHACENLRHLRNAIAYTHANPVRAGLCEDPRDYPWSSHAQYDASGRRLPRIRVDVDLDLGLGAFMANAATDRRPPRAVASQSYRWAFDRILKESPDSDGSNPDTKRDRKTSPAGDSQQNRPSLVEIANRVIEESGLGLSLDQVRSPWGPRWKTALRRRIAFAVSIEGYKNREIASLLGLSESAVSRLLSDPSGL